MKTNVERKEKSIALITIEESAENVAKYRKKAVEYISKNADIKGFRKWTEIPESVIVKTYWEDHLASMTIEFALDDLYKKALKKEKLMPVWQAEVSEIVSEVPLKIVMKVEVFPEITIKDSYKKIKIKKTPVKVEDSEVDAALEDIKKRFTNYEKATKAYKAKMWDKVYVDTEGFDLKGEALENTNMSNYPLVLGSNTLVPGFEEQLVGAKTGEEKELDIEFPKDYHNEEFKGKKTKFKVKINEIEKAVEPEFTPEFIKWLRGKETDFEGFKEIIKWELKDVKESNNRLELENKLIDELEKISEIDYGDGMLNHQIERVYEEAKQNIAQSGGKMADYLSSLGMDEDKYKEDNIKPVAERRLKSELILHKLNELENIELTDDEIQKEIESIIARFENEEVKERMKGMYKPGTNYYEEVKYRMSYRKLIDSFFE